MLMAKDWKPMWTSDSPQGKQLFGDAYATLAKWGNYQGRYWDERGGFRVDDYTNWPHTREGRWKDNRARSKFDHPLLEATAQREGLEVHVGATEESWPNHPRFTGAQMSDYHREEQHLNNPAEHKFRVPYLWADVDGKKRVHFRHPYEVDNEMAVMELDTWYYINFLNGKSAPNDFVAVDEGDDPWWVPLSGGEPFQHNFIKQPDAAFGIADNLHFPTGREHHYLIRFRDEHFGVPSPVGPVMQPNTHLSNKISMSMGISTPNKGYRNLMKWMSQGLDGKSVESKMRKLFPDGKMPLYYWNDKVDVIQLPQRAGQRINPKLIKVDHNSEGFKFAGEHSWLIGKITAAYLGVINYVHWPRGVLQ